MILNRENMPKCHQFNDFFLKNLPVQSEVGIDFGCISFALLH
jgi:hypothetical protein